MTAYVSNTTLAVVWPFRPVLAWRLAQDFLNASQACPATFHPGGAHFDCSSLLLTTCRPFCSTVACSGGNLQT